jgi:hypothetical protein
MKAMACGKTYFTSKVTLMPQRPFYQLKNPDRTEGIDSFGAVSCILEIELPGAVVTGESWIFLPSMQADA